MMKMIGLTFLLITAFQNAPSAQQCDQVMGNKRFSDGDKQAAFEALYDCESDDNATGLSLGQLGFLYVSGYGIVSTNEGRAAKAFHLFRRAAKLGNVDAITTVARIYESGEPSIKVKASPKTALCLDELVSSLSKDVIVPPAKVAKCLPD